MTIKPPLMPWEQPLNPNVEMKRMGAMAVHPLAPSLRPLAERLAFTPGLSAESAVHLLEAAHSDIVAKALAARPADTVIQ
jgi:hypothetical protein